MGSSWFSELVDRLRRASLVSIARPAALIMLAGAIVFVALGSSASGTVTRAPTAAKATAPATARVTAAPAATATPATAPAPLTRYSIVNGCYQVNSATTGAPIWATNEPVRMQAAALGVYLLYTPGGNYLVDTGGGTIATAGTPSNAAEWTLNGSETKGFTITNGATATTLPVKFVPADGCATYPNADVDATGSSFTGSSPEADVLGTVEGHAHVTAFELFGGDWHCGRPWSPFGAEYALPASCAADEQGTNGEVETFLDFGGATRPSNMHGWPTFVDWPSPTALAEEGDYYTGIERAWKAGLRVMVTNLVDNEALCNLMTTRTNPCNDTSSAQIQSRDLYGLQNYIDAQSGGPGKGWFRIVTNPFQARQVINQGKLAVIEGVEMSEDFGCGEYDGTPQCDESQIDSGLKEFYDLGVRTFFPIHEFNNAFGGSKMIAGDTGLLINAGNREETGSFFNLQSCPAQDQDAEQVTAPDSGPLAQLINGPLSSMLQGSALPVYGSGPQCNTQGLTDLGSYVIKQMIKDHYIIQLDHMDSKTATAALGIATAAHYAGVVSAHCCSSPQLFKQIYANGGFVTEPVAPAIAFAATEKTDKALSDPKYHFGFGYGSDMNGLAEQPGPTSPEISYPFRSYLGNVTFTQEQWGQRTFNYNTDGMANYGLYADWLNQLQQVGGTTLMSDMFQGAEGYLEMWERAYGVPSMSCLAASNSFSSNGLAGKLRLGDSAEQALYRAGQPLSRPGRSYRYCIAGGAGTVASVFNAGGHVALIASTAHGDRAAGIASGASTHRLRGHATKLSSGLWVGRKLAGGDRYVYGVNGKRVSFVAVATAAELRSVSRLRSDLVAAGL